MLGIDQLDDLCITKELCTFLRDGKWEGGDSTVKNCSSQDKAKEAESPQRRVAQLTTP